jgi:hypothetical protein
MATVLAYVLVGLLMIASFLFLEKLAEWTC